MNINLPLQLTGTHQYARQSKTVDLIFDNNHIISTSNITNAHTSQGAFTLSEVSSGYDANNIRITNIAGYNGFTFLKYCPHCERIKPLVDFDNIGRYNSSRDQSNCNACRGSY